MTANQGIGKTSVVWDPEAMHHHDDGGTVGENAGILSIIGTGLGRIRAFPPRQVDVPQQSFGMRLDE